MRALETWKNVEMFEDKFHPSRKDFSLKKKKITSRISHYALQFGLEKFY